MVLQASLQSYWGKAHPRTDSPHWHPLVYHSLDVAATGLSFLRRHDRLRVYLSRQLGFKDDQLFVRWLIFFLALHDLGKFSEGFQRQNRTLFDELHGPRAIERPYSVRHDSLGFLFWIDVLMPAIRQDDWFGLQADQSAWRRWQRGLNYWSRAVMGHHGKPPKESERILEDYFSNSDKLAAVGFCDDMRVLLLGNVDSALLPPADVFAEQSQRLSWWLAGIAVLADWVGSNQTFFKYREPRIELVDYWKRAQRCADQAIQEVGVLPTTPAQPQTFGQLFPEIHEATPLQRAVSGAPLGSGPQLVILEDVTGAGKTEAAVMVAHRLMGAGLANGMYVGLPTMATANAMFERMERVYQHLFAEESQPSLVLSHSARDMSERFRQSILPPVNIEESAYAAQDEQTASSRCKAWLAENRKRALLAEVGIGTIDQALLAILYSNHQSLRLLGLFGKVLVVDEVHACDAYMHRLLQGLLRFHASTGGSAILLSATLSQEMRAELTQAFCEGARIDTPVLQSEAYPLLTHIGGAGEVETPLTTRSIVERVVSVSWLTELREVYQQILQAIEAGQCVCWIRNTVADARAGFSALQGQVADDKLHLFHARFALQDRLDIEQAILGYFSEKSNGETRAGRLVIATQVVEQSLDLDFDVMISDLAPVDLIIQRAGRLCRHTRDRHGNRIDGSDERGTPKIFIYGPEPIEEAERDWFALVFPKVVKVYPNHGQLWLTAKLLKEKGKFHMPNDARYLIESVYGEDATLAMPVALEDTHYQVEGEEAANRSQAQLNSIPIDAGYETGPLTWWDDAVTPTRLADEPSVTIRLARWDGQKLSPWATGEFAWQLSQVTVRQSMIQAMSKTFEDRALQTAVKQVVQELPDRGKWSVLLPLQEERIGFWRGQAVNGRGEVVVVFYDIQRGLIADYEMEGQA